jgi:hypothetical protein
MKKEVYTIRISPTDRQEIESAAKELDELPRSLAYRSLMKGLKQLKKRQRKN